MVERCCKILVPVIYGFCYVRFVNVGTDPFISYWTKANQTSGWKQQQRNNQNTEILLLKPKFTFRALVGN
jgi:hypothetical protein